MAETVTEARNSRIGGDELLNEMLLNIPAELRPVGSCIEDDKMHNSSQQYRVHRKLQVSTEGSGKPGLKGTRSPCIMEQVNPQIVCQSILPVDRGLKGGC